MHLHGAESDTAGPIFEYDKLIRSIYTFRGDGQIIDLDVIVAGLDWT